ncbi:hypothetical protein E4T56_gene3654 [Termitomyces sp. T112]|nr:hypothetical protein E4T56_gene3654 [Termitomyces sp. T112]
MPPQAQDHPTEVPHSPHEKHAEHDPSHINRNLHHKEALSLRLALGSILGPKRPFTPSSHSPSGTASPAHPSAFGSPGSPGLPPPPPHTTPIYPPDHLFPRGMHLPHTPSRLGHSDHARDHMWPSGSPGSAPCSAPYSPHGSSTQTASPTDECPPVLALPPPVVESDSRARMGSTLHAPKPRSAPDSGPVPPVRSASGSGCSMPRNKFMETLESKSAWDALIHGSFS